KDILIACGVAAAISSGFNAPIGGIIFAHEALLRRFSISAVAPISVASIVAAANNSYFFNSSVAFSVSVTDLALGAVVPLVILFAPICTLVSIIYMVCLRSFQSFAASQKVGFNKLIFLTALTVGLIGIWVPDILGLGGPQVDGMIAGQYSSFDSLVVLILKILVTAACVAFGFFGGVFGPALFMGAAVGSLLTGILVQWGLPSDYYSVLSVATMAAVGASVIGAPITVVLIVIELTQSYQYGLMALLSVTISSKLTYQLFGLSFFDRQLLDRGIDMTRGREYIHLSQILVREIESSDYVCFNLTATHREIIDKLRTERVTESYILDNNNKFLGKLNLLDVVDSTQSIEELMDTQPLCLHPDNSITEALEIASQFVGESIPIIEDGHLLGALTEGDLFSQVLTLQEKLRAE
ncbi:MAG: chloride channel protein, partial [Betaproteobacteria bacterium]